MKKAYKQKKNGTIKQLKILSIYNIRAVLFTLYTIFVIGIQRYCEYGFYFWGEVHAYQRRMIVTAILLLLFLPLGMYLASKCKLHDLKAPGEGLLKIGKWKLHRKWIFFLFFFIAFIYLFLWYLGYYPGGFASDCIGQYGQALTDQYNDWHPVLQTLIAFKLPLLLTRGWIGSIILFQILLFSLVLSYTSYTILCTGHIRFAVFTYLYMLLNPRCSAYMMNPLKDSTFAIFSLLLMTMSLKVFLSDGEVLEKKAWLLAYALVAGVDLVLRHNGILFVAPLVFGVCLYAKRRTVIKLLFFTFAVVFLIRTPLYSALHVSKPGSRQLEMLGLPMIIIGNVAVEDPRIFDQEDRDFVYGIASQETWNNRYIRGSFNRVKFSGEANLSVIDQAPLSTVFRTLRHCFERSPVPAFQALFDITGQVLNIYGFQRWDTSVQMTENDMGLEIKGNEGLRRFWDGYADMVNAEDGFTKYLFGYIGVVNWLVIGAILLHFDLKSRAFWKKLMLCLPILVYNFGTMLLLTGRDNRFFFLSFFILPLVLFILFYEDAAA